MALGVAEKLRIDSARNRIKQARAERGRAEPNRMDAWALLYPDQQDIKVVEGKERERERDPRLHPRADLSP